MLVLFSFVYVKQTKRDILMGRGKQAEQNKKKKKGKMGVSSPTTHVMIATKDDQQRADGRTHQRDPRIGPTILPQPARPIVSPNGGHLELIDAIQDGQVEVRAREIDARVGGGRAEQGMDDQIPKREQERAQARRVAQAVALSEIFLRQGGVNGFGLGGGGGIRPGGCGAPLHQEVEDHVRVREDVGWDRVLGHD